MFETEPSDSGGRFANLPWWLILTVAFVVTELTTHPAIGVSVLCLKFGWDDFRTSAWLRSRDPNRKRGAVCSWFYVASGTWRVFIWSTGLMCAACILLMATQPPQVWGPKANAMPPPEVIACIYICLASFAVATIITLFATRFASRHQVKVWISGEVSQSRRLNEWPPQPRPGRMTPANLLKSWLLASGGGLFLLLMGCGITFMLVTVQVMFPGGAGNKQLFIELFAVVNSVAVLLIMVILILIVRWRILPQIEASSPADCWPVAALDSAADTSG